MSDPSAAHRDPSRLIIVLNNVSADAPDLALIPFRYAVTAAAMDVAVEVHAVSRSVRLFKRGFDAPAWSAQIVQAAELGVQIFVCPVALAEQTLALEDLVEQVAGVRGAASLLVAGLGPGARFMVF